MRIKVTTKFREELQNTLAQPGDLVMDMDGDTARRWIAEKNAVAVPGVTPDLSLHKKQLRLAALRLQ